MKNRVENQPVDVDTIPEASHPTKRTRLVNKAVWVALVVVGLTIGLFLYWSLQSSDILKIKNSPFPSKIVQEGPNRVVILDADSCKLQAIKGELRISFVSQTRELFQPIVSENSPVGCRQISFPIIIPADLPADTYKIKFRASYDLNPLKQDIIQDFESRPITIGTE